jgi:hypothetical protein
LIFAIRKLFPKFVPTPLPIVLMTPPLRRSAFPGVTTHDDARRPNTTSRNRHRLSSSERTASIWPSRTPSRPSCRVFARKINSA